MAESLLGPLADLQFYKDMLRGLTDAGNRGFVGGLLGAPIDMATGVINAGLMGGGALGQKMGLLSAAQMPDPIERPVGGSEWIGQKMQDAGMVSDQRNAPAEMLAGLLGPGAMSKAGKAAWVMEQNAAAPTPMNAALRGQAGAIVYHGSPHQFDAFDISKIGTGEGAQAYGRGLYFAQSPDVASDYANKLSRSLVVTGRGYSIENMDGLSEPAKRLLAAMQDRADSSMTSARGAMARNIYRAAPEELQAELSGNAKFWDAVNLKDGGHLYHVDLPDQHIAKMLDWDKTLAEQPHVVAALTGKAFPTIKPPTVLATEPSGSGFVVKFKGGGESWITNASREEAVARATQNEVLAARQKSTPAKYRNMTGADLMQQLGAIGDGTTGSPDAVAKLRSLGIPGVKYLDGGSRGQGKGTYNYVVFDDKLPKIVGRE